MKLRWQAFNLSTYVYLALVQVSYCSATSFHYMTLNDGLNPGLAAYSLGSVTLPGKISCAQYCESQRCQSFLYLNQTLTCTLYSKYMSYGGAPIGSLFFTDTSVNETPLCTVGQTSDSCLSNIALGTAVTMSSTHTSGDHLVDGDMSQSMPCAHTYPQYDPWIQIDLGQTCSIWEIHLYNRMDCCSDRLRNLVLSLGTDSASLEDVYYHAGVVTDPGGIHVLKLSPGISAKIFKIALNGTDHNTLNVCEANIYGHC